VRPTDVNGINKVAGEYYHLVYNNVFGVRGCSLRLTNIYGPRQLVKHNRQGFIGWFIRLAVEDREIQVYGDGSQLRDFVFVDDAADAFLRAGASDVCNGEVFNVGGPEPVGHRDLVQLLLEVAGTGRVRYVDWPAEKKAIDIGSFYADSSRFRAATGWEPRVGLREGLERTVAYYRQYLQYYLEPGAPEPEAS
jgi:UDP-glucose 4-epimerase